MPSDVFTTSLSWVTGEHNVKFGATYSTGDVNIDTGSEQWLHRTALSERRPVFGEYQRHADHQAHRARPRHRPVHVQDSWTRGRLTLNPGVRFDYIKSSIRDQTCRPAGCAGAGVHSRPITKYIPRFTDISPRFGVAYDLFGNGKTAVKGAVGRYLQNSGDNLAATYNL